MHCTYRLRNLIAYLPFAAVPDFGKLRKLAQIMLDADMRHAEFSPLLFRGTQQYGDLCGATVGRLMDKHLFGAAWNFSQLAGLPSDHVSIKQVVYSFYLHRSRNTSLTSSRSLVG
jgi:hypothetical protein